MDGLSAPCYNRGMMKKAVLLSFILLFAAYSAFGCAKETENVVVLDDPAPESTQGIVLTPFAGESPAGKASVALKAAVAYAYTADGKPTLYGAVEFENTGTSSAIVKSARFTFRAGEKTVTRDFEPVLYEYDAVAPGESSFVTLWLPDSTFPAGTDVTLEAELTCESATIARRGIEVKNLFLADNYPGFTTMSGTLENNSGEECTFLMTYVGFYNESGKLLGVWYFTKNIRLGSGEGTDFVSRMEDLPVNGLSDSVQSMKTSAFGFQG